MSLECARVLSKAFLNKVRFPATIVFLTVAGEEQGLNGSKHFAEMAKQQGWKLEAVLNNDIVGGDLGPRQDASVVRVFSEGLPAAATELKSSGFESSAEKAIRLHASLPATSPTSGAPTMPESSRFWSSGWTASCAEATTILSTSRVSPPSGSPNFAKTTTISIRTFAANNGIEYGDLPKFVGFDYVAHVARLNAATLASLASAPAPPATVKILTKNLENDTTLTWEPSTGATAYEVVWRSTNAADWEYVQAVSSGTRATLKFRRIMWIFGVRALDAAGHRSLPVVPEPER